MHTGLAKLSTVLTAFLALCGRPCVARAADAPPSLNTPPGAPGTPERGAAPGPTRFREGFEAAAAVGSGFADTYLVGFEGRLGYTLRNGVYVGGNVQHFLGHTVGNEQAHATFVGAEVGYKVFPLAALEIRPYALAGPAFVTQVADNPFVKLSKTDLAIQPGVLGTYHFGSGFVGADAHAMLWPSPNTVAVMATAGLGF